jgi:drug/metabolite transporter (DMT)-like permease
MLFNEIMFLNGLISILIFAFVPLAIKYTSATPLTICLFRLLITVFALALLWRKKIHFNIFVKREGLKLWLLGFVFFIHWMTYAYAVKIGGASIGVLGLSTYGIQLIIAGTIFLDHHISRKDVFCLIFSFLGIVLIIPSWNFHNETTLGLALALISASSFALIPILHSKTKEHSEQTRIFAQFSGALICFLFFAGKTSWQLQTTDWLVLFFLSIFGTLIAHSLWAKIASSISPNITGLAYYTIAPITILSSAIFLGEKLTGLQLSGAAIVIVSAIANIIKV